MADAVTTGTLPPWITAATLPAWAPSLVALDLDGTCLDDALNLTPRLAAAVAAAATRIPVVVATGRMYRSALPWAQRLGVTTPLICYQGALIREQPAGSVEPGAVVAEFGLDGAAAQAAIAIARRHGWHRQAYRDDHLLCEEDRPEAREYGHIARVDVEFVDDLEAAVAAGSTKIVVVIDTETAAANAEVVLREELKGAVRVVRSLPQFVEITNVEATKSLALGRLCQRLGVDIGHAVAVGDAPNDTDMLAAVGFGVAVDGARDGVLGVAQARCAGPEASGVADVLEAFGL